MCPHIKKIYDPIKDRLRGTYAWCIGGTLVGQVIGLIICGPRSFPGWGDLFIVFLLAYCEVMHRLERLHRQRMDIMMRELNQLEREVFNGRP